MRRTLEQDLPLQLHPAPRLECEANNPRKKRQTTPVLDEERNKRRPKYVYEQSILGTTAEDLPTINQLCNPDFMRGE